MHTIEKFLKCSVIAIMPLFICLSSTICYSAWPLFQTPVEPKAYKSYVYDSSLTLIRYLKYTYDNDLNLIKRLSFDGPGDDGIWFTKDDQVKWNDVESYFYNSSGLMTMELGYSGPGPDGIPFTDDDLINDVGKRMYDTNEDMIRRIRYTSEGTDGIWLTADDVVYYYRDVSYDYGSFFIRDTRYTGPGNDGIWFNADDQIEEYDNNYFHSNFRPYFEEDFNGPGADGKWYTADDIKREQDEGFYDDDWNLIRYVETKTSGEVEEITLQYDDNNNCTRLIRMLDSVTSFYNEYKYDDQNRMIEAYQRFGAGPDGVWFTNDDIWTTKIVFELKPSTILLPFLQLLLLND